MTKPETESSSVVPPPRAGDRTEPSLAMLTCPKVRHDAADGYLHDPGDDSPYEVDGLRYCGRCHYLVDQLTGRCERPSPVLAAPVAPANPPSEAVREAKVDALLDAVFDACTAYALCAPNRIGYCRDVRDQLRAHLRAQLLAAQSADLPALLADRARVDVLKAHLRIRQVRLAPDGTPIGPFTELELRPGRVVVEGALTTLEEFLDVLARAPGAAGSGT